MADPSPIRAAQQPLAFRSAPRLEVPGFRPLYGTDLGDAYVADALDLLKAVPDGSIDLVTTSPPYALHFKKEYGNADQRDYVAWFLPFAHEIRRVLADHGSFVLNIGGKPMRCVGFLTVPSRKALLIPRPSLDRTPEQRDEADRIKRRLLAAVEDEVQGIAELLASKPEGQLLGAAEFQVRDRVPRIGARAIEAALDERKKGATRAPVSAARPATAPASSAADRIGPSSA